MTKEEVKAWVVQKASVTQPTKAYWSASVTLGGMDINGTGPTIESAYNSLTWDIHQSKYYLSELERITN